jgi:hypothetical protein
MSQLNEVKFWASRAVIMKITDIWDVKLYTLVDNYQHTRKEGAASIFRVLMLLRNIGKILSDYAASAE